jgi:A/G-specific adenine glycosylase
VDQALVRQWYSTHQRDLPWRAEGVSAWQILVSEVMLQQTPVARVIPAWQAWCERWPTAQLLAAASLGEVLSQWNRLGYPRRAKNLHRSAQMVTEQFGGELPRDVETLETLPGIGTYTSRAIACFAFGIPVPVVDTNVKRVVARVEDGDQAAGHWSVGFGLERVDEVSRTENAEHYCQIQRGLMELGALLCTARSPRCETCPLQDSCRWRAEGYPEDPSVKPRVQARYEGSDRQVRGIILSWLRQNPHPLERETLEDLWPQAAQRQRAVESLVRDGLIERHERVDGPESFSLSWLPPGRVE